MVHAKQDGDQFFIVTDAGERVQLSSQAIRHLEDIGGGIRYYLGKRIHGRIDTKTPPEIIEIYFEEG